MLARLCFEISRAGGRLLETGTENFLKLKGGGKLGDSASLDDYLCQRQLTHG